MVALCSMPVTRAPRRAHSMASAPVPRNGSTIRWPDRIRARFATTRPSLGERLTGRRNGSLGIRLPSRELRSTSATCSPKCQRAGPSGAYRNWRSGVSNSTRPPASRTARAHSPRTASVVEDVGRSARRNETPSPDRTSREIRAAISSPALSGHRDEDAPSEREPAGEGQGVGSVGNRDGDDARRDPVGLRPAPERRHRRVELEPGERDVLEAELDPEFDHSVASGDHAAATRARIPVAWLPSQ